MTPWLVFKPTLFVEYVPRVFGSYNANVMRSKGDYANLDFWDTAGSSDFDSIRYLSYFQTDIIFCFFAVNDRCLIYFYIFFLSLFTSVYFLLSPPLSLFPVPISVVFLFFFQHYFHFFFSFFFLILVLIFCFVKGIARERIEEVDPRNPPSLSNRSINLSRK